jgi:hypothetical protein
MAARQAASRRRVLVQEHGAGRRPSRGGTELRPRQSVGALGPGRPPGAQRRRGVQSVRWVPAPLLGQQRQDQVRGTRLSDCRGLGEAEVPLYGLPHTPLSGHPFTRRVCEGRRPDGGDERAAARQARSCGAIPIGIDPQGVVGVRLRSEERTEQVADLSRIRSTGQTECAGEDRR